MSTAVGSNAIWDPSEQVLSTLRTPELWFEHISELVRVENDELHREVKITISTSPPLEADDWLVLSIQSPHKGLPIDTRFATHGGDIQLLSHHEHIEITRAMILFRFRAVLQVAMEQNKTLKINFSWADKTVDRLLGLVSSTDQAKNARVLGRIFTSSGHLRDFPRPKETELRVEIHNLYLLAQTVSERYFKFVRFRVTPGISGTLTYSYAQEREARSYGVRGFRIVRRLFRAPKSLLLIHAPLARLTAHYELRIEPIEGYYVRQQFALLSKKAPAKASTNLHPMKTTPRAKAAWWSSRRGGWTSGFLFIANGNRTKKRIYGAFRHLEVPPGATGRAWAGSVLSTLILIGVVTWSLTHSPSASIVGPEILLALMAAGAAVLDNTTPSRQLFNSPFIPRLALFSQTVIAIIASIWLLARSTVATASTLPDWLSPIANFLTLFNSGIGITLLISSTFFTFILSVRSIQATNAYDEAMRERR